MISKNQCEKCRFSLKLGHGQGSLICDFIGIMNRPRPKTAGKKCPAFEKKTGERQKMRDGREKSYVVGEPCEWVKKE